MAFYDEMPGWHNSDATNTDTIRLARLAEIHRFSGEIPEETRQKLISAGFTRIEFKNGKISCEIPFLFDAHMHLRDPDGLLSVVGPVSTKLLTGAVVMPNTGHYKTDKSPSGAITGVEIAKRYEGDLQENTTPGFTPMMTLTFGPDLTTEEVEAAKNFGIVGVKWYPAGGTVNADKKSGNISLDPSDKRFESLEKNDLPFLIHAQRPLIWSRNGEYITGGPAQAERDMMPDVIALAEARPNLKIVIEHISTKEACEVVRKYPNVSCTVTPQHLIYDDADIRKGHGGIDIIGSMRPEINTGADRAAIVNLVLHSPPEITKKIRFGTDSAPHPLTTKLGLGGKPDCCANGAYNLPVAFEMLFQFLEEHDRLNLFPGLAGGNAADFFGYDQKWLQANGRPVHFVNEGYDIPRFMEGDSPVGDKIFDLLAGTAVVGSPLTSPDKAIRDIFKRNADRTTAVLAGGKRIKWRGYPTKRAA